MVVVVVVVAVGVVVTLSKKASTLRESGEGKRKKGFSSFFSFLTNSDELVAPHK